jgi:hypothetical protein
MTAAFAGMTGGLRRNDGGVRENDGGGIVVPDAHRAGDPEPILTLP